MDVYKELQALDLHGVPEEMYRRIAGQSEGDLEWAINEMIGEVDQMTSPQEIGRGTKRSNIGKLRSKIKELEKANPGACDSIREAGVDLADVQRTLASTIPSLISKRYEPSASANVLAAQLEDLVVAM